MLEKLTHFVREARDSSPGKLKLSQLLEDPATSTTAHENVFAPSCFVACFVFSWLLCRGLFVRRFSQNRRR